MVNTMNYLAGMHVYLFALLIATIPHSALAQEIIRCGALPDSNSCSFYNKLGQEAGAHIYAKADKDSPVVYSEHIDFVVRVDANVAKPYPEGWLPVVGIVPPKGNAQFAYKGWLPLDTVVDVLTLKRVVGCWPYSKVEAEIGEVVVNYRFDTGGNYLEESDAKLKIKGHLYYGEGIVLFRQGKKLGGDYAYFDPRSQAVTQYDGYGEVTVAERFAPSLLKGCGPEPTVEGVIPEVSKPKIPQRSN